MKMASLLEKMLVLEKLEGCGADIHTSCKTQYSGNPEKPWPAMGGRIWCIVKWW